MDSVTELFGFGGIHIATNHTSVEFNPDGYAAVADTQSSGLADIFINLKTHSEASGLIIQGQLQPRFYRGEVHRNGTDSYGRVEYRDDGSVIAAANPPSVSLRADPAATAGTTDQMTAFLLVERQVAMGRSCTRDIRIFDGRHIYALHFRDAGSEPLEPAHAAAFIGPIRLCRMVREVISGFADTDGGNDGVARAAIYYARLAGDELAIPLHVELQTEFGAVIGRLVALRVNGAEWPVPEWSGAAGVRLR